MDVEVRQGVVQRLLFGAALDRCAAATLLFDEIEKAHPRVLDLFLQMLDAARVTLADGHTLDLSRCYIVMTSNLGSAEIMGLHHSAYTTMERHVLLHTAIGEFVARQPVWDTEEFAWDRELSRIIPGEVVDLSPAPQHWIWDARGAFPHLSARRLTGFLSSLLTNAMTNMNAVVEEYITRLPGVKSEKDKLHMALLCELYFFTCGHQPGVLELQEKYASPKGRLNKPTIHAMLFRLLTGGDWDWPPEKSAEMYTTYEKQRVDGEFSVPLAWELALMLEVANQFDRASNESKCAFWKDRARLEATGHLALQTDIAGSLAAGGRFYLNGLFECDEAVEDRRRVEERAFFISLRRKSTGVPGDDLSDWLEAEAVVFEMEARETLRQQVSNPVAP